MHVLLFDIDGTLIRSGGAGKAAMELGLMGAFGIGRIDESIPYGGRTDGAIVRDLLRVHGIEATVANAAKLQRAYQEQLRATIVSQRGEICRGISELLPRLHRAPGVTLGLLTGNVRFGAQLKLAHFGLWDYFAFGGFADEVMERSEVGVRALREAERHLGRPAHPERVWVIGDTPHDVACARHIGAKAVAVATGWHSREELADSKPDVLVNELAEARELLAMWEAA